MTQEQKMRSDFAEALDALADSDVDAESFELGWQAATAHTKQEMVARLDGEDVVEKVQSVFYDKIVESKVGVEPCIYAKAAITEIKKLLMEGI